MRIRFFKSVALHLKLWTGRLALVGLPLLTLVNIYISLKHPSQRRFATNCNEDLWSQNIDFERAGISNDTGTLDGQYLVPNYVHFIRFGFHKFTYVEMICVLAALKNQKPDKIIIHRNHNDSFTGRYWEVLTRLSLFTNIFEFNYVEEPTEIFDQPIAPSMRRYHGSDIVRIRILMKYGGIFLDGDSYIVRSLDGFRRFEMTLSWDDNEYLGTQVLLAHKDARFLKLWLESYRGAYKTRSWYYNAGVRPTTQILWKRPELIHRVKLLLGTKTQMMGTIFQWDWPSWQAMYAVHLFIYHQYLLNNLTEQATFPVEFDETNIGYYPITFRNMAYDVYDVGNISWPKRYTINTF